jgi:F0F1-type ATP synthase assembly protein I
MNEKKDSPLRSWVLILQLGLTAITPIILCVALGWYLKHYQGLDLMLLLSLLGIVSGSVSAWRMAARYAGKDDEETQMISGIYDGLGHSEKPDTEDPLMEEYQRNNQEREKLLEGRDRQER